MTHNDAQKILDLFEVDHNGYRIGYLRYPDGMKHRVYVMDVRETFGRTDVLAQSPHTGTTAWVAKDRCLSV